MSKRTTSAAWVKAMTEMFAGEGLDSNALVAAAGIDPATLEAPGARLPTEQVSHLWQLAVERSGNPLIGLAQHRVPRPASFDVVGYTMMSSANLRGAFERLVRYLRILSDAVTIDRQEHRDLCRLVFVLQGGDRPVPRARIEFILVTLASFCRWVSGDRIGPRAVEIPYPVPADPKPYLDAFGCPVSFGAPAASLLFALDDLDQPLSTSNSTLAQLHERFAGEYLERFGHAQISTRVREVILRRLPDGEPRRDQVARELGLSERTLQRRLEEEQTSFHQVLDDARRELAQQYLGRLQLSLAEAAYLLGFAEESSFFRACKRWFGVPPGQYRSRLSTSPR
jgi:AraC-like DNA-binding protein